MNPIRLLGVFTIVPGTILLTLCFFVLLAVEKAAGEGVRRLGKSVAVLLCICAGLVFGAGLFALATGVHPAVLVLRA